MEDLKEKLEYALTQARPSEDHDADAYNGGCVDEFNAILEEICKLNLLPPLAFDRLYINGHA